jgi:hypothetical protein
MQAPRRFVIEPGQPEDLPIPFTFTRKERATMQATPHTDPAAMPAPKTWAVLELYGRTRVAGAISEHTLAGATFVRVDVPLVTYRHEEFTHGERHVAMRSIAAHSRLLGPSAIYGVHLVDEAAAVLAAQTIRHEPLVPWELRNALRELPLGERTLLLANDDEACPF